MYTTDQSDGPIVGAHVYRKVARRIVPFLFAAFCFAYIDRMNVGFAKAALADELEFSATAYGLGAGLFFIGYFLFEVPSNLMMHRIGIRKTLFRIMVLWGLTSSAMMFVNSEASFYILRFLLGTFEAGFVPAMLLYLTYWYPGHRLARMIAMVFTASAVAGVIGAPLSGFILSVTDGWMGMSGWRWMFLLEGIPTVILGMMVFKVLADKPATAKWLTPAEKDYLEDAVEVAQQSAGRHGSFLSAVASAKVWTLCFVYFCLTAGVYLVNFWLPTLISEQSDLPSWQLGLVVAIPYLCAAGAMVAIAGHSDRTGERRWHITGAALVAVVALIAATQVSGLIATVTLLSIATGAIFSAAPIFFSIPSSMLTGAAAAGGIALVNSVGNLSGFVSPIVTGRISDMTGSLDGSLWALAALLLVGCAVLLITTRDSQAPTSPGGSAPTHPEAARVDPDAAPV
ncbi:MFS transporter [Rhodococcus sp. LB1]|uniref:MFS transporter n=1 Tax=Rhodococcus sp. LB1 TaxID=1807499 RepID=UPI0007C745C8|nr:MFS transporter [Rhodococcus sp. LB1]